MHERSRLQRMACGFVGHARGRELAKLVVDYWQQLVGSFGIALPSCCEDARDITHGLIVKRTAISRNSERRPRAPSRLSTKLSTKSSKRLRDHLLDITLEYSAGSGNLIRGMQPFWAQ